jgi:hypothetical protein
MLLTPGFGSSREAQSGTISHVRGRTSAGRRLDRSTRGPLGYPWPMADAAEQSLDQQLEGIGAQLAWVRDYL